MVLHGSGFSPTGQKRISLQERRRRKMSEFIVDETYKSR
jgi:hypothetical protein